jgi:hypothetical protein
MDALLMQSCHVIGTVDPCLQKYKSQLENLIDELMMLRHAPELGLRLNPYELQQFQEQLNLIESFEQDGKFLDSTGNIPKGQAELRFLIERAHDLVNECLLMIEGQERDHKDPIGLMQSMGTRLLDAQDALWTMTRNTTANALTTSRNKLDSINHTLTEGAEKVKDYLTHPGRSLDMAASKVAALTRSGLSVLTRYYAEMEPVDPALKETLNDLESILSHLLEARNEINKLSISKRTNSSISEIPPRVLLERVETLHSELDSMDRGRVNGNFLVGPLQPEVLPGQNHLKSLLNENYCLVFELKDRLMANHA